MSKIDFLTQARIDDEEFVRALAQGRNIRKEMNIAYSRIKRRTTASILTNDRPRKGDRSTIQSQQGTARPIPKPKPKPKPPVPKNQKADLFVVTKVRMKAKRPSEQVPLPKLNPMPDPVGSTRIYL